MIDWLRNMIALLINEHWIDLINCACQIIVAVAAVVAIIITLQQVSGKSKVKLKATTKFQINERHDHTFCVELVLYIVNLGMAPVYISESGIQLWDNRKEKWQMIVSKDPIIIKPGDIAEISCEYNSELVDDHAALRDTVSVYAKCQLDRCWFDKSRIPYGEFKHESEKVSRSLRS